MRRHPPNPAPDLGPRRRQILAGLLALGGSGVLTACSEPLPPLRVGSIVFPTYEYAFLARDLGWLDERLVRLVELPANTYSLRALAAGQLDACQLTLDEVVTARSAGIDLAVLLVLDISAGADAIYARQPIALAELRGKRIAVESGANGAVMLEGLLNAAGLAVSDIRTLPMTLDRSVEVFHSGEADLVVTAPPWSNRIEAEGGVRVFDSRALPNLIVDVLAVRRARLASHAATLRLLVSALLEARQHQVAHPEDAARRMATRLQLAPADVPAAFMGLHIPGLAENRTLMAVDGPLVQSARELLHLMQAHGLLRRTSSAGHASLPPDLFDLRFLPATLGSPT
ncbi:ABC transporter substrate-binding protein [Sphaerotilus mobilis]|uniref:NitT/TauT family transport system substrate-binding protein n=1 Tax=Sphaerotilus mobilis TaxID=47994 RepID=A0A4Q7LKF5_9BURK|nr:ABC transporter substrate-binding protein [Sphaerotilus mobilis]RZS54553.1 NitT/TauT family transport system substrate-binding protein [Sphaerotilus mobilis]